MNQDNISINILGYGYVGSACGYLCDKNDVKYNVCDLQKKEGDFNYFNNIPDTISFSESNSDLNIYMICVPTPSDSDGNCDTSIVKNVLTQLNKYVLIHIQKI